MSIRQVMCCVLFVIPMISGAQQINSACRADVQNYCSQSKGSMQQATDCLLDHQQEISDTCYDALKQRLNIQQGIKACKQDVDEYCHGIQAGGGRIVRCLMDHQKDVSDACYDTLARQAKAGRKQVGDK